MIEILEDFDRMKSMAGEWSGLEKSLDTPLLSHEWFMACAESFCPPQQLKIVVGKSGEKLTCVVPLSSEGKFARRLEVLGTSIIGEPGGFIYADAGELPDIIHAIVNMETPVYLKGLRIYSEEAKILEGEIRAKRLRALIREERIPAVKIQEKWETFEKQISPSRRSSFRRLQRLAESKGKVEFEVVVPTPDNIDEYLEEVFAVEAAGWKGRIGGAMRYNDRLGNFFKKFAGRMVELQKLYLFFLRVDGKAIAVGLTTFHANRIWISKIGYDESWSFCSPGILMMHQLVRYCFEKDLEGCEFLGADEPWLHIWANESHSLATYRIYPRTTKGLILITADFLQMSFNKIRTVLVTRKAHKRNTDHA